MRLSAPSSRDATAGGRKHPRDRRSFGVVALLSQSYIGFEEGACRHPEGAEWKNDEGSALDHEAVEVDVETQGNDERANDAAA